MTTLSFVPKIIVGDDALDYLSNLSEKDIFIVTDNFIKTSQIMDVVIEKLKNKNTVVFSEVVPDPPIDNIVKGIESLNENESQVLLAIGGGSALDAAKGIMYFAGKTNSKLSKPKFIAIPTTSGTGSEVTNFSVITDSEKGIKYPLVNDEILPDVALLVTDFVKTLPAKQTADTGIDVLTHAIEAYVSTSATVFSDALAEKAIKIVFNYLPSAYLNGEKDTEAREKMHYASTLAGMAFNMASLGINHSIAHSIGGKCHLAHGRINGVLLTEVIEYNSGISDNVSHSETLKKYSEIAKMAGVKVKEPKFATLQLNQKIKELLNVLEIPNKLSMNGVDARLIQSEMDSIAKAALNDRCTPTNPKIPDIQDIKMIIEKVL